MSQYRQGQNRAGGRMNLNNNEKFNNLRKLHQVQNHKLPSIQIISNRNNAQNNRPVKILTARKAASQAANGRAAKIQKNLQHMKQAAFKKKQAQEHYYGQGQSPMVRPSAGNFTKQNTKGSVQQRLGVNGKPTNANRKPFVNNSPVNTNNRKQFVNNTSNTNRKPFINNTKQSKINRITNYSNKKSVQTRLNVNGNNNVRVQRRQNQNQAVKTVSLLTGEVKYLRPLNRNQNQQKHSRPVNYTVCVENSKQNYRHDNLFNGVTPKHHVSSDLNPAIQQEIRMLQNKAAMINNQGVITQVLNASPSEARVPIMTTRTTLHERFSKI